MDATTIITQIFLPVSLAIIMFGMGLTLVVSDFGRLFAYPKEVLIGLFNQLIFLPLIGFLIILLFDLDSSMAIGIMILSLCPGGPTSNLITPIPLYKFPGLKPGDKWCLCVSRWIEAEKAGKAPKLILEATHEKTLKYTSLETLIKYALINK